MRGSYSRTGKVRMLTPVSPHVLQTPLYIRVILRPSSPPTVPKGNHSHTWLATEYY